MAEFIGERKWRDDYITYKVIARQKEDSYGADLEIRTWNTEEGPTEGQGICYAVENVSLCGLKNFCDYVEKSLGAPGIYDLATAMFYAAAREVR